jgi:hypothetical protein
MRPCFLALLIASVGFAGGRPTRRAGARVAPGLNSAGSNLKAPYTHEAAGWFERQFTESIGLRAGFVYKTEDNLVATYIPGRGLDVYQRSGVPLNFVDIGLDGVRNSSMRSTSRTVTRLRPIPRMSAAALSLRL